jgi:hypothetical protein
MANSQVSGLRLHGSHFESPCIEYCCSLWSRLRVPVLCVLIACIHTDEQTSRLPTARGSRSASTAMVVSCGVLPLPCGGGYKKCGNLKGGAPRGSGGGSYTNWGWFPIQYVSLCILHVSCMYPEGYMYPECILMYLKCILHALLHSKRIHVSFTLCMYFTRIPNESTRYILGYT